jgi:hypothetical protein
VLDAAAWAAVIESADGAEQLGVAGALDDIPPAQRRRLPPFTRNVVRCALPLMQLYPGRPLVYAAEHGDLDSTLRLLADLARGELLSPALFALSVHNAPAGALSLAMTGAGDHTAIAGGAETLPAALTEAYARLADGTDTVLVLQAEARLPSIYEAFDTRAPDAFMALALRIGASAQSEETIDIEPGRAGVVAAVRGLAQGRRRLCFTPPILKRAA